MIEIFFVAIILLRLTTLLEVTNFLGMTVFLAGVACFVKSICIKSASIEDTDARVIKDSNVGGS